MFPISGALDRVADRGKEYASREISRHTGAPEDLVRTGLDVTHKGVKEKKSAGDIAKDVGRAVIKKGSVAAISGTTGIPAPLVEKGYEAAEAVDEEIRKYAKKTVSDLEEAALSQYPRKVQNFLNKYSGERMTNIRVCRKPLGSTYDKVFDVLSLGSWSKAKKKENFDSVFHLYLTFTLGGKHVILDKQHNITIKISKDSCKDSLPVPISGEITLKTFLERGRKRVGDAKFFPYNALTNNCQDFLLNLLVANGLNRPNLVKFIKQDLSQISKELPGFSKSIVDTAKHVADLAERAYQNLTEPYEGVRG